MISLYRNISRALINNKFNKTIQCCKPLSRPSLLKNAPVRLQSNDIKFGTVNPVKCISINRARHSKEADKDDDDLDSDDEALQKWIKVDKDLNKFAKVTKINVTSLRVDGIIKGGLNVSRNKAEVLFYESKIRLNGKKVSKKSATIAVGDEIDIIKSISKLNSNNLEVSRVEILDIVPRTESICVIVRRYKNIVIENYEEAWRPSPDTA